MSLLFRVLHAVHARGTHHKLALDAVSRLAVPEAEAWQRVFLKHSDRLMAGAKAPDDEFKDFTNHVLHPRDNWWGGAPSKARSWYEQLVTSLAEQDWAAASYNAGVLSHYLSDPLQPFHTGQSEAESNIHRAFEWSTSNAYAALMKLAANGGPSKILVGDTSNWLEALVTTGAGEANAHYEKLLAHFDIHRSVVDPASGLDVVARRIIAMQLDRAISLVAVVIDRAIVESGAKAPEVALGLDTLLALIKVPAKMWTKRLENAEERRLVEAMYDELKATGTVEKTLPEDDRMVRDRHAAEVPAKRPVYDGAAHFPYQPKDSIEAELARRNRLKAVTPKPVPAHASKVPQPAADRSADERLADEPPRAAPVAADLRAPLEPLARRLAMRAPTAVEATAPEVSLAPAATVTETPPVREAEQVTSHGAANGLGTAMAAAAAAGAASMRVATRSAPPTAPADRVYLTGQQPIVDAPSIGPKMAERLEPLGLKTVDDLFAAVPETLATALEIRGVDAATVRDWQAQARLVCTVPGLRGTHAQLLVGAGFRDAAAIAESEADQLCGKVLAYAASPEGQRVLRNGDSPDIEKIKVWLENARLARAA